MIENMRIAFLGAGFIGLPLILECLKKNYYITVLDRNPNKIMGHEKHLNWCVGEFHDEGKVAEVVREADVVFHLISSTVPGDNVKLQNELFQNVSQTLILLNLCVSYGVKKLIFISSSSIYGEQPILPISETALPQPLSTHGINKITIEYYLQLYQKQHGLNCNILRLSNPYGPGQPINGRQGIVGMVIGKIKQQHPVIIRGNGSTVRDFIYISDVIHICMKLTHYFGEEMIFNAGSGNGTKIIDLVKIIDSLIKYKIVIKYENSRKDDITKSILDITKIKNQFDLKAPVTLHDGLIKTLKFHGLM